MKALQFVEGHLQTRPNGYSSSQQEAAVPVSLANIILARVPINGLSTSESHQKRECCKDEAGKEDAKEEDEEEK